MREVFTCYLDVDDKHPQLYGECILPRDDDGIGFALGLEHLKGKFVRITIEEAVDPVSDGPSTTK